MKTISLLQKRPSGFRRASSDSTTAWLRAVILAGSVHGLIAAQGPVSAVQDALKREKYYAGESNGTMDEPTRNALRWYQTKHGLPVTGEIDSDTLQALENSKDAGKPTIQSVPHQSKETELAAATVEKDRAFLQEVEQVEADRAHVQPPPEPAPASTLPPPILPAGTPSPSTADFVPPPAATVPATPVPGAASQPIARVEEPRLVEEKKRPVEKMRPGRQPEGGFRTVPNIAPDLRPPEAIASGPHPRPDLRGSAMRPRYFEEDVPAEMLDEPGVRVTRSTARGLDGRTIIVERRTAVAQRPPAPVNIRRAIPVEPRGKRITFFDRLFNDADDDD